MKIYLTFKLKIMQNKKSAKGAGDRLADLTFVFNYFLNGFCGPFGPGAGL